MVFPTAKVSFKIDELEWEELVAVAPVIEGQEREVLYSLNFRTVRGLALVMKVIKSDEAKVLRVTTRAEAREASLRG